jgi:hypothetical protein
MPTVHHQTLKSNLHQLLEVLYLVHISDTDVYGGDKLSKR